MARASTAAADAAADQAADTAPPDQPEAPVEPTTQPPVDEPAVAGDEPEAPQWGPRVGFPHQGDEWGNWLYTGPPGRIYSYVPVTVDPGDVIHHLGIPADDGCWQPTEQESNKQSDNWRPEPAPADDLAKEG